MNNATEKAAARKTARERMDSPTSASTAELPTSDGHNGTPAKPAETIPLSAKPPQPKQKTGVSQTLAYKPFPKHVFPPAVRDFVSCVAKSIGCDVAFAALPMLGVLSHAIGTTRVIQLKKSWREYALLWLLLIARSGSAKSPAMDLITRSLYRWQKRALRDFEELQRQHEADSATYEKRRKVWEKTKGDEPPPEQPVPPKMKQVVLEDVTIESVAPLLLENERGILGTYDEWLKWHSMQDRYSKGGTSGESGDWHKLHGVRSLIVNRKTADRKFIFVERPYVPLLAVTQPGTYQRLTSRQSQESGSDQRWLKAYPPQQRKQWTESEVYEDVEKAFVAVLAKMETMEFGTDEAGEKEPAVVRLSTEAKRQWIDFYNSHADEQSSLDEHLSSTWSKLECYCARFMLIVHCTRWAAGDAGVKEFEVDVETVNRAVTLTQWFCHESKRVHALLTETDRESEQRELLEWIQRQGGRTTSVKLLTNSRRYGSAAECDRALQAIVDAELGDWSPVSHPQGGRPTRELILRSVCETPATPAENIGFADTQNSETEDVTWF